MTKLTCKALAVLVLLAPLSLHATDYYVAQGGQAPVSDYTSWATAASNIQDAVDVAAEGDTVWIAPGTYTAPPVATNYEGEDHVVYLQQKLVTLRSSNGIPSTTIIDGEGANRCIAIVKTGAGSAPFILDGLTVANGMGTNYGGGILCNVGGAKNAYAVVLRDSVIRDNMAYGISNPGGAGLYNNSGTGAFRLTASNTVFRGNVATNLNADPLDRYTYQASGGAVYCYAAANKVFVDCTFEDNMAGERGGAMWNQYSTVIVSNCVVRGNRTVRYANAGSGGGAFHLSSGYFSAYNSLFVKNRAASIGAVVRSQGTGNAGIIGFESCTIASNRAGSIISIRNKTLNQPNLRLLNSIVQQNVGTDLDLPVPAVGYMHYAEYSCFSPTNDPDLTLGPGVIDTAPKFINLAGGQGQLWPWSAGVDAGTNQAWMATATDLGGNPRIGASGLVDMGCYETTYKDVPDYYAAQNGQTPVYPYTNWATAATDIQDAVDAAPATDYFYGDTVWVGPGTYTAPANPTNYEGEDTVLFFNQDFMTVRGSEGAETTIIDGEGANRCVAVRRTSSGDELVLDGLTIRNGYATNYGGGILCNVSGTTGWDLKLLNCIVSDNVAWGDGSGGWPSGGGLYNSGGGDLLISNTVIRNNVSTNTADARNSRGGGVYSGYQTIHRYLDSTIEGNISGSQGGGVYAASGRLFVSNCIVRGNNAMFYINAGTGGGGLRGDAYIDVYNTVLCSNYARYGAAIGTWDKGSNGIMRVINCTIVTNLWHGSIYIRNWDLSNNEQPHLLMTNSIMYHNIGTDINVPTGGYPHVAGYSCLDPTNVAFLTLGPGNIDSDPQLENLAGGNYRPSKFSPCVNAGLNMDWMTDVFDLAGNPRIDSTAERVDMGAYELVFHGSAIMIQ